MLKLLEEHNYTAPNRNRIYEHNPAPSVSMHLADTADGDDPKEHSSMQDIRRTQKLFLL